MKKLIIALLCAFSFVNAQNYGRVTIHTSLNQPFVVSLNGVRLNNQYTTTAVFDYLEDAANYSVKIWFQNAQYPINMSVSNAPGYESVYLLHKDQIGAYVLTLESKALFGTIQVPPSNTVVATTTVVAPVSAMSDADFKTRLASVQKESFEDAILNKAKLVFASEHFTAAQVAAATKAFSFDDRKLDFAKFAYSKTIDQNNYYMVVDALTFINTKKSLEDFIKKK